MLEELLQLTRALSPGGGERSGYQEGLMKVLHAENKLMLDNLRVTIVSG
jgi:hypothetical protein